MSAAPALDPRRDVGRADAQPFFWPAGPTACLLVHGLTSTPYEVREIGSVLHHAGYTVRGIRLPGHGTRPEDLIGISWPEWIVAVEAAWADLARAHERIFAIGSSLGASLVLWLAADHPLSGVVGLGTPVRLRRMARFARLIARVRPLIPKRPSGSSIRDPEARARHPSYGATAMHAAAEMASLVARLRPRLPKVTAPVLLIHSRHDSVVAPANAIEAYETLGSLDKTLLWVENSDHIISEDYDKRLVFQAILEFLARIEMTDE
ncbi:MAG: alpha/beta fold hydrolase [Ardenticatenaceae bacterium]|nr:alpha/beta fold hydrolase [Ardenticatenaceae bacterium]HBY99086.1 hypothetical protein [Chloroflexota bacterium]